MIELKTAEDWWNEYDTIQDDIKSWLDEVPNYKILSHPQAERILGHTTIEVAKEYPDKTNWEVMDILYNKRDRRLYDILNGIWNDAPDKSYIHEWPSWGRFCDLCSEGGYLLFSELEGDDYA